MKILVVKYLPSAEQSATAKLLERFYSTVPQGKTETLDLLKTDVPAYDEKSMAAYKKRHYMGQTLTTEEAATLAAQDRLTAQFKAADVIVMAYPMHNFGMPGKVKLYFDAVMQNGVTFEMGAKKCAGKKALTLYAAGGQYNPELVNMEYPNWDALTLNAKINFAFMGFDDSAVVSVSLRDPATAEKHLAEADKKLGVILKKWF